MTKAKQLLRTKLVYQNYGPKLQNVLFAECAVNFHRQTVHAKYSLTYSLKDERSVLTEQTMTSEFSESHQQQVGNSRHQLSPVDY